MSGSNKKTKENAATITENDHFRYHDAQQGASHPGATINGHSEDTNHKGEHDEHGHGHGHHWISKEEAIENSTRVAEVVEKVMQDWRVDPMTLDWSKLYDKPYSNVYDQWWSKLSHWSHSSVLCRPFLAHYRHCEEKYIANVRTKIHWSQDLKNPCREEGFWASLCVAPLYWRQPFQDLTADQQLKLADITFPAMRLASATIQIPQEWADAARFCDPNGRPSQNTIPSNTTIGCILPKAFPQEYIDLQDCLLYNDSQDISHPNCQFPVMALAEKWGAFQKTREIIGDDFENKTVFPEFVSDFIAHMPRRRKEQNEKKIRESYKWFEQVKDKRSGSINDFLDLSASDLGLNLEERVNFGERERHSNADYSEAKEY